MLSDFVILNYVAIRKGISITPGTSANAIIAAMISLAFDAHAVCLASKRPTPRIVTLLFLGRTMAFMRHCHNGFWDTIYECGMLLMYYVL